MTKPEFLFVGGRELRAFPKGWLHPRDERGRHIPLLPYGSDDEAASPETTMPPTPWAGETEIAAYETVTEGTPISPAFPDTSEGRRALVNWCTWNATVFGDVKAGHEAWAVILFGDARWAVTADGSVIAEALDEPS